VLFKVRVLACWSSWFGTRSVPWGRWSVCFCWCLFCRLPLECCPVRSWYFWEWSLALRSVGRDQWWWFTSSECVLPTGILLLRTCFRCFVFPTSVGISILRDARCSGWTRIRWCWPCWLSWKTPSLVFSFIFAMLWAARLLWSYCLLFLDLEKWVYLRFRSSLWLYPYHQVPQSMRLGWLLIAWARRRKCWVLRE